MKLSKADLQMIQDSMEPGISGEDRKFITDWFDRIEEGYTESYPLGTLALVRAKVAYLFKLVNGPHPEGTVSWHIRDENVPEKGIVSFRDVDGVERDIDLFAFRFPDCPCGQMASQTGEPYSHYIARHKAKYASLGYVDYMAGEKDTEELRLLREENEQLPENEVIDKAREATLKATEEWEKDHGPLPALRQVDPVQAMLAQLLGGR